MLNVSEARNLMQQAEAKMYANAKHYLDREVCTTALTSAARVGCHYASLLLPGEINEQSAVNVMRDLGYSARIGSAPSNRIKEHMDSPFDTQEWAKTMYESGYVYDAAYVGNNDIGLIPTTLIIGAATHDYQARSHTTEEEEPKSSEEKLQMKVLCICFTINPGSLESLPLGMRNPDYISAPPWWSRLFCGTGQTTFGMMRTRARPRFFCW